MTDLLADLVSAPGPDVLARQAVAFRASRTLRPAGALARFDLGVTVVHRVERAADEDEGRGEEEGRGEKCAHWGAPGKATVRLCKCASYSSIQLRATAFR